MTRHSSFKSLLVLVIFILFAINVIAESNQNKIPIDPKNAIILKQKINPKEYQKDKKSLFMDSNTFVNCYDSDYSNQKNPEGFTFTNPKEEINLGNSPFTKGYILKNGKKEEDYCKTTFNLIEYSCENGKSKLNYLNCKNGCKNSVCIEKPSCFDNIKNQGEQGIDCGDPCNPCIENKCTDLEGFTPDIKDSVNVKDNINNVEIPIYDSCVDNEDNYVNQSNELKESVCEGDSLKFIKKDCTCKEGKCIPTCTKKWTKTSLQKMNSVFGFSKDNVYSVGENGQLWHYDGTEWNQINLGNTESLTKIWGFDKNNIYILSKGDKLISYNGKEWTQTKLIANMQKYYNQNTSIYVTVNGLEGIWGTSIDNIYAVGPNQYLIHYDGKEWSGGDVEAILKNNILTLNSITEMNKKLYAVGYDGNIVYYDDNNLWKKINLNEKIDLLDIWGDDKEIFIVGSNGIILHYEESILKKMESNTTGDFRDISGNSKYDIYAVGDNNLILHFNGVKWESFSDDPKNMSDNYEEIWPSKEGNLFLVTANGNLLMYGC